MYLQNSLFIFAVFSSLLHLKNLCLYVRLTLVISPTDLMYFFFFCLLFQPLDENDVVRTAEGADTVTILHHTLNICTNSVNLTASLIVTLRIAQILNSRIIPLVAFDPPITCYGVRF